MRLESIIWFVILVSQVQPLHVWYVWFLAAHLFVVPLTGVEFEDDYAKDLFHRFGVTHRAMAGGTWFVSSLFITLITVKHWINAQCNRLGKLWFPRTTPRNVYSKMLNMVSGQGTTRKERVHEAICVHACVWYAVHENELYQNTAQK